MMYALTSTEIRQITGTRLRARQVEFFARLGIRAVRNLRGDVIVARAAVDEYFNPGASCVHAEIDMEALIAIENGQKTAA